MMLMICATGALRLGRGICGALAVDGVGWGLRKFKQGLTL